MEEEKAQFQQQLEAFKAQLNCESERTAQTFQEKIVLYKEAISPVIELIAHYRTPAEIPQERPVEFEEKRLSTPAPLGMFSTLAVFETYNALIDYSFDCLEAKQNFSFPEFSTYCYKMLNEIRRDVGISEELVYRGNR